MSNPNAADLIRKADMKFRQAVKKDEAGESTTADSWLAKAALDESAAFDLDANEAANAPRRLG